MGPAPSTLAAEPLEEEPLTQIRPLTATERQIQQSWIDAVKSLDSKIEPPPIIFEEDKVYLPDKSTMIARGLSPEMYPECEQIFKEIVLKQFDEYRYTSDFVINATTDLWGDFKKIVISNPNPSSPFLDVMNKKEIEQSIIGNPYMQRVYRKILAVLEYYNRQFPKYDVVIYINAHGTLTSTLELATPLRIPGMNVSFLSYAQLGECGFAFSSIYKKIHELFDRTDMKSINMKHILEELRALKYNKSARQTKVITSVYGASFTRQQSDVGWRMYTRWSQRYYEPEKDPEGSFVPKGTDYIPIEVLYDSTGRLKGKNIFAELLGRITRQTKQYVSRSDILTYLYMHGYRNPLIVDISCAVTNDLDHDDETSNTRDLRAERKLRAARRSRLPIYDRKGNEIRAGINGGTRRHRKRCNSRKF
jgi:hypothetical protein